MAEMCLVESGLYIERNFIMYDICATEAHCFQDN